MFIATAFLTYFSLLQRAQDLANVTAYREWVFLGYLVCPDELLRVTSIDIALVTPANSFSSFFSYCVNKFAVQIGILP